MLRYFLGKFIMAGVFDGGFTSIYTRAFDSGKRGAFMVMIKPLKLSGV